MRKRFGDRLAARAGSADRQGRKWALTREQNLTYLKDLPDDNHIVEGTWWSDPARAEASVEVEYAHDLGAGVGSTLVFDGQGVTSGTIIVRQRGTRFRPGPGAGIGRDDTIFARRDGRVVFKTSGGRRLVAVVDPAD